MDLECLDLGNLWLNKELDWRYVMQQTDSQNILKNICWLNECQLSGPAGAKGDLKAQGCRGQLQPTLLETASQSQEQA